MGNIIQLFNPLLGIKIIIHNKSLLQQMLLRNIALRYRGSILGFIWSFAHPLLMLAVYTFVFGIVFKARWGDEYFGDNKAAFPLIIFCGIAIFNIFSESVNTNTNIIASNPSYVKKVVFPLELLPICTVLTSFVFGMVWFFLLFVGTFLFLGHISWTMLFLPIALLPLFCISLGISFFVASLGVYLRDTQQLVAIITQMLFFMTPIFYPVNVVPEKLRWIININPLSYIIEEVRLFFLYGHMPNISVCLGVFALSLLILQFGLAWFSKTKKGFADVL